MQVVQIIGKLLIWSNLLILTVLTRFTKVYPIPSSRAKKPYKIPDALQRIFDLRGRAVSFS
jgi:hypothetical protein